MKRRAARLGRQFHDTFYIIGTTAGPHPDPEMVRNFQSVEQGQRKPALQMLDPVVGPTAPIAWSACHSAVGVPIAPVWLFPTRVPLMMSRREELRVVKVLRGMASTGDRTRGPAFALGGLASGVLHGNPHPILGSGLKTARFHRRATRSVRQSS